MFATHRASNLRWFFIGSASVLCVGTGAVFAPLVLLVAMGAIATAWAMFVLPIRWVGTGLVCGVLLSPTYHVGPLLAADVALLASAVVALARGKKVTLHAAYWWFGAFAAWGILRTGFADGLNPFVHTFAPVTGAYLVSRLMDPKDAWFAVKVWAAVCVLTSPFLTDDLSGRWSALSGGIGGLGLLSAVLVITSYSAPVGSRGRVSLIVLGFIGIAGSQSLASGLAAITGVFLLRPRRPSRRRIGPSLSKVLIPAGVAAVLASRPDLSLTVTVHRAQAEAAAPLLEGVNPVTGGGWLYAQAVIVDQGLQVLFATVHNVYLQLLTDTGIIGLGMFLAGLWATYRRADPTTAAVLVGVAVWLNTTGAYPGPAWGLLGIILAATTARGPGERDAVEEERAGSLVMKR